MKKAGIAAVFGFLAAKDKKKVDDDEDGNRSADEVQGDNTKLGASHPVAALTTSKVDFKVTTTASSARPSLTKADSMSMQILGKSLEQKTEERETNIRWAEPTTDSAHRQDDEEDVDAVLWNNKTVPSNNEVDAEDIAKHFHISMNRRQARNQVSSKRAAKFLSKAPKEGEKGINLLIHKKAVSEIEVADYAPVNAATNASPMSSRKFISADDDLSFAAQQSGSTEQNKHQPKMSNGPLNAKKRASVIGMVGISQFYQMSPVSEVKERDRNEELLESIMADMLTEDALKSPTTEYEEPSLIDEYSVNLGESLIDEIDNNTEKYSNPESKPRYSYPDDPPEDDDDLEDLPPDEDDSFPPEEDSLPPLSEFDVLPESEPGDDSRSQLSFPSVPSSKPSNVGSRPPPPPPPKVAVKSALNMDVLSQIKGGGASLRTAETQPRERVVDLRTGLMNSIKAGSAQLRNVAPVVKPKFISTVRVSTIYDLFFCRILMTIVQLLK